MPSPAQKFVRRLTALDGGVAALERARGLHFNDAGHGFDPFGLDPYTIALIDALSGPVYHRYFRVRSVDPEHIPSRGPAILAANHSGTLPFDGWMLWMDVLHHTDPPRVPRTIADFFVPLLPTISTLFARGGVVTGSRGNVRALLEAGELLQIFPEGIAGIGKPFSRRYQLEAWRQGHCELAIRYRAPVIPVGIVGAEEQMPQLGRIPLPGAVPYVPVPAVPFPLPVRYHIYYGEPLRFDQEYGPDDADNPAVVDDAARRVKASVQALLSRGLRERRGIFR